VALRVTNLPADARQARVTVCRVDKEHGSLYGVTERADFPARRESQPPGTPPLCSPAEIAALREASALAKDPTFKNNEGVFPIVNGTMSATLTLTSNRVEFVEVDWGTVQ